ncbi:unnamed protein product [Thelazia callipaeda]|uniref:PDDEXK_1 domain-containing protein n=1 Tax=Thelazia callipaeda TaxID=103827 RepID=A0A0N5DAH2_THECL|nr:unnamed protein product [Thelazia callipaeda]
MRCGTVAYVGMKTIRYGTVITPNVVKDVLGALPEEQLTAKNTRFLKPVTKIEDGRYPSVSTILGCTTSQRSLYHWQLKMIKQLGGIGAFKKHIRGRMMIGTQYHSCVQRILGEFKNRRSFPDNVAEEVICTVDACVGSYVNSVLPILRTFANNNMELERHTSHHGLCYNGRFDATVTYKDALFLMDWKTVSSGSTKDNCVEIEKMYNDPLQLAAYIGAVNSDSNFKTLPEVEFLLS